MKIINASIETLLSLPPISKTSGVSFFKPSLGNGLESLKEGSKPEFRLTIKTGFAIPCHVHMGIKFKRYIHDGNGNVYVWVYPVGKLEPKLFKLERSGQMVEVPPGCVHAVYCQSGPESGASFVVKVLTNEPGIQWEPRADILIAGGG